MTSLLQLFDTLSSIEDRRAAVPSKDIRFGLDEDVVCSDQSKRASCFRTQMHQVTALLLRVIDYTTEGQERLDVPSLSGSTPVGFESS